MGQTQSTDASYYSGMRSLGFRLNDWDGWTANTVAPQPVEEAEDVEPEDEDGPHLETLDPQTGRVLYLHPLRVAFARALL